MGNCWALLRPRYAKGKPNQNVVRVVKIDGKMLEFKAPLPVKDVLVSKTVSPHLPRNYELKMGSSSSVADTQQAGGVKRIKVVITKQELQQLLNKKVSVAEVLAGLEKPRNWKPKLESILEEND
ncbi:hypothetical protein V6N13_046792 [Hibiscus sabdariffa]|uniref:Uncharacterized protein n=2 Tax=Hibiscus sabdariffa TaxID=183260 RepID=A0ABR1Z8F1_9ROSI